MTFDDFALAFGQTEDQPDRHAAYGIRTLTVADKACAHSSGKRTGKAVPC